MRLAIPLMAFMPYSAEAAPGVISTLAISSSCRTDRITERHTQGGSLHIHAIHQLHEAEVVGDIEATGIGHFESETAGGHLNTFYILERVVEAGSRCFTDRTDVQLLDGHRGFQNALCHTRSCYHHFVAENGLRNELDLQLAAETLSPPAPAAENPRS